MNPPPPRGAAGPPDDTAPPRAEQSRRRLRAAARRRGAGDGRSLPPTAQRHRRHHCRRSCAAATVSRSGATPPLAPDLLLKHPALELVASASQRTRGLQQPVTRCLQPSRRYHPWNRPTKGGGEVSAATAHRRSQPTQERRRRAHTQVSAPGPAQTPGLPSPHPTLRSRVPPLAVLARSRSRSPAAAQSGGMVPVPRAGFPPSVDQNTAQSNFNRLY